MLEDQSYAARFPNRYWMTLSADKATLSKWEAQATMEGKTLSQVWEEHIRTYLERMAVINKANLICIYGIDGLHSFHVVILCDQLITRENWLINWTHAKASWMNRESSRRVFGKMCERYDEDKNGIPYIFHHHSPYVSYIRHRKRSGRKDLPIVIEIKELIKRCNSTSPYYPFSTERAEEAPTEIVSFVKSKK